MSSIGEVHCQKSSESAGVLRAPPCYFFWKRDSPDETVHTKGKVYCTPEESSLIPRVNGFAWEIRESEGESVSVIYNRDAGEEGKKTMTGIRVNRCNGTETKTSIFRLTNLEIARPSRTQTILCSIAEHSRMKRESRHVEQYLIFVMGVAKRTNTLRAAFRGKNQ